MTRARTRKARQLWNRYSLPAVALGFIAALAAAAYWSAPL